MLLFRYPPTFHRRLRNSPSSSLENNGDDDLLQEEVPSLSNEMTRRHLWIRTGSSFSGAAATTLLSTSFPIKAAVAAYEQQQEDVGMVSTEEVAQRLRVVPTFVIVDAKEGIPYMVVGEDARVTGYFFTTYDEANRLLQLAKRSADDNIRDALQQVRTTWKQQGLPPLSKQEEIDQVGINPWTSARISTVPLDVAVTLTTRTNSIMSSSARAGGGGNYFQVAPAQSDVEDALALDSGDKNNKSGKQQELAEGRVPLFYMVDFELRGNDGSKQSPLYFRKSELLADWKKLHPLDNRNVPEVRVTELFRVLTEMVKPGGKDKDLTTLVFVPPKESSQRAKECLRNGGKDAQFLLGKRIVVL